VARADALEGELQVSAAVHAAIQAAIADESERRFKLVKVREGT